MRLKASHSDCPKDTECCSAVDTHQDGNEGLLVPDHVDMHVFADRLKRPEKQSGARETAIPAMYHSAPSTRTNSTRPSRAPSPNSSRKTPVSRTAEGTTMDQVVAALRRIHK